MTQTSLEESIASVCERKGYPKYRDSGIKWLGVVPAHWQLWKLSHAFETIGSGTTPPSDEPQWYDGDTPWVTTGELRESQIRSTDKYISDSALRQFPTLRVYPPGTLLIAMYGATIGRLGLLDVSACTNQACCALSRSDVLANRFVFYWLQAFREQIIYLASGGGQPNINQEEIKALRVLTPPVIEQRCITTFLDRETAKIDALVAKKERLIELLQEKRAALITRAVTKGLDPNFSMKDSGVDWLGEIPAHWEAKPLKWVSRLHRGYDLPDAQREEGTYPVVTSGGVVDYHSRSMVAGPGVVTGRYGSTGNVFYVDQDFWPHNTALYVSSFYDNLPRFIFYLLQTLSYEAHSGKSAVPGIDRNDLHEIFVALPPRDEQRAIVNHIETEAAGIDALIGKIR